MDINISVYIWATVALKAHVPYMYFGICKCVGCVNNMVQKQHDNDLKQQQES